MEKLGSKIGNKNNVKTYLSATQFFHHGFKNNNLTIQQDTQFFLHWE